MLWKTLWKTRCVYRIVTRQFECFSELHHSRASAQIIGIEAGHDVAIAVDHDEQALKMQRIATAKTAGLYCS